jgi:hypothetical protein
VKFTRTSPLPGENFYTPTPQHWVRDHRMPALAFKILVFWNSHELGYEVGLAQTVAEVKEGRDAIYTAVGWLLRFDYLQYRQDRNAQGLFGEAEYELGPAAFQQQYVRAWGGKRMNPQVRPLPGNPDAVDAVNETAGQTASWESGYGSAVNGSSVNGQSGHIRRSGFKKTNTQEPPPAALAPSAHVPTPRSAEAGGGGDRTPTDNPNPPSDAALSEGARWREAGRRVLEAVQHASGFGRRQARGTPAAKLAEAIGARLAAGWTAEDATAALTGKIQPGDSVVAVLTWRVANLLADAPPESTPTPAPPPWCGECDSENYRWHLDDQGRPAQRCPDCNPQALADAARGAVA